MPIQDQIDLINTEQSSSSTITNLDPRLQLLLARRRSGVTKRASAGTDTDEVGVLARVTDEAAWNALTEVREPVLIGEIGNHQFIVTGRIPIHRIERIRQLPFVSSLKAAQPIRPMLATTTNELEAQPSQLPVSHHTNGGKGVVVGIVDYGCDFAHENFRNADGTTRLLALWDQNGGDSPSSPFGYGKEYASTSLNFALTQANPYTAIGYDPADFDSNGTGTHGTHVLDIAAGNGRGSTYPGMAPNADVIFVNITHDKDPVNEDAVGKSFGNSVALIEALRYIFQKSGDKPTVINVSLGTNGGPHDGTTLVEQGIDALLNAAPNRAVVFAASNSYDDGIHAAGTVGQDATIDLDWNVVTRISGAIEMEIWFAGTDQFQIDLIAPNGVTLATTSPGESKQVTAGNTIVAFVANRLNDPNNHDNMIGIFLGSGMPAGKYVVRLRGITVTNGNFHAWIERDNSFQSSFLPPYDNSHTIGSVSCGNKLIAVGSYDGHVSAKPLSYFSSAGPTRDGPQKPEISAPGHNVWAAKSGSKTGITRMSGTSMAAPAVAGLIALIFEEAQGKGINLTIDQTVQILCTTARRSPPSGTTWHDRYGFGRASAAKAIDAVINQATNPIPLESQPTLLKPKKPKNPRKKKK